MFPISVRVTRSNGSLSIVVVHGLNPLNTPNHAWMTWTHENGKLWLRDFLPEEHPTARVLLFGYNANVAFNTSTAGVNEQANQLLNRLWLRRDGDECTRPIIFIAHSLGGIIVKQVRSLDVDVDVESS